MWCVVEVAAEDARRQATEAAEAVKVKPQEDTIIRSHSSLFIALFLSTCVYDIYGLVYHGWFISICRMAVSLTVPVYECEYTRNIIVLHNLYSPQ